MLKFSLVATHPLSLALIAVASPKTNNRWILSVIQCLEIQVISELNYKNETIAETDTLR